MLLEFDSETLKKLRCLIDEPVVSIERGPDSIQVHTKPYSLEANLESNNDGAKEIIHVGLSFRPHNISAKFNQNQKIEAVYLVRTILSFEPQGKDYLLRGTLGLLRYIWYRLITLGAFPRLNSFQRKQFSVSYTEVNYQAPSQVGVSKNNLKPIHTGIVITLTDQTILPLFPHGNTYSFNPQTNWASLVSESKMNFDLVPI